MSCAWTYCENCKSEFNHVYLDQCPKCKSFNVTKEYDNDGDLDTEVQDEECE